MAEDERKNDVHDTIDERNDSDLDPAAENRGGRAQRVSDREHEDIEDQNSVEELTSEKIAADPEVHERGIRSERHADDSADRNEIQADERSHDALGTRPVSFCA